MEDVPFDIPVTWKWVTLGSLGIFTRGSGIKRDETTEEGSPCVRYGQLYTTYHERFSDIQSKTSKSIYDKCHKIKKNDIVMALTGENNFDIALASVYTGDEIVAIGGDMTKYEPIIVNSMYLMYVINSAHGIAFKRNYAKGNIIVHISNDNLSLIPIPLPPIEEQQRIVDKLETILPLIENI